MTNHRRLVEPIAMLAIAEATELIVFANGQGPIRVLFGLAFTLLVPGWAVLRLIRLETDLLTWLGLAVAVSCAVDIGVSLTLLYLEAWSIQLAVTLLVVIVMVLIALDLPFIHDRIRMAAATTVIRLNRGRTQ
ncbi:MAG TPA: hypothetical protein VF365_09325 [Candidatus Limnocylindria bacterium]